MHICLLTAYFPPEVGSASHLFFDLGGEFARRGHAVTVLTGYPTYNIDKKDLPEAYRRGGLWMRESMNGMEIIRMRSLGTPRHIPVLRGIGQFVTAVMLAAGGLFLTPRRADVMLVYSPPLFLGLSALVVRAFRRGRVIVNIQDLFPQSAVDLGILSNGMLISAFRGVERHVYGAADVITVHSPGNKAHVERNGGTAQRTFVVHNPVDTAEVTPGERMNEFRRTQGVSEAEFVVSFAGVLGYSQDLDIVLETAALMRDLNDVVFYIVGDGVEKPRLQKRAEGMASVRFLPMLPKEEYVELLHASDVCLATLRSEVKTPVVPSKILSIMAAGRPVAASLPLGGDAPDIIRNADCGICVASGDAEGLAAALRLLHGDRARARELGSNGRKYAEAHFSLPACASRYLDLFGEVGKHGF